MGRTKWWLQSIEAQGMALHLAVWGKHRTGSCQCLDFPLFRGTHFIRRHLISDGCQQLPRLIDSLAFPALGAGPVLVLHQPSPPPSKETEQKGWVTRPTWCSPKNWP